VLSNHPEVSSVVIIDGRPEIRASVGADFSKALQRRNLAEAIDDVDAIVVATPPESHFDVTAEAIAAGKHALVEKPMATSSADAMELVRMAEAADVILAAGHTFAYNAAVWKLAELVRNGSLGKLHYLDAARLNLGLYREDVNVLWDLAAHDISITTMILGTVPDTVSAWGSRHTTGFAEDVGMLRMMFDRQEVESTVRASWLDPLKIRTTTVVGSDKMAIYDDVDEAQRIKIVDRSRQLHGTVINGSARNGGTGNGSPITVTYREGGSTAPEINFKEPLQMQANDFLECCRTGAVPMSDGKAGLAVVAVLEASDRSLEENGAPIPVNLPHLRLRPSLAVVS
jgi:predicted dehydrogenase